jgi:hypothetical protein
MQSFLRRQTSNADYFPSIDDDIETDSAAELVKRGTRQRNAIAERHRQELSYSGLSADRRATVDRNVQMIQEQCARRVVRPENDADYKRLYEAEMARADVAGPASTTIIRPVAAAKRAPKSDADAQGVYEVDKFADMLSIVRGGTETASLVSSEGAGVADTGSFHSHDRMDTQCYQIKHTLPQNVVSFNVNPMFTCTLMERNRDAMCALMQMSQYDTCETALDKFRDSYAVKKSTVYKFGEYLSHFADEAGLRLFCAYVTREADNTLFAVFEMDGVRRYFVIVVLQLEEEEEEKAFHGDLISKVRVWHDEAMNAYRAAMQSTADAPFTYRPCTQFDVNSFDYWALYNILMCKSLQNQRVSFLYAYYSTCQCVKM